MPAVVKLLATLFTIALMLSGPQAPAEVIMIPDRCPEPCEVGGTHVSPDYQRLTVPFRIRNGGSGDYLKLNGRSVSVEPLVENDDSFLWVLLPGPQLHYSEGDVSEIISGNNFEERVYKLINLKNSMALMSDHTPSSMVPAYKGVFSDATNLGDNQFWLFQKDPAAKDNARYLIYNPIVQIPYPARIYDYEMSANINPADAKKSNMLALKSVGKYSGLGRGASFAAADFTWRFEEAPRPRDLARLTLKSVRAVKVSTGRDGNTDILLDSLKYSVEYGPMVYSLLTTDIAKRFGNRLLNSLKSGGEIAAESAAESVAKTGFKDSAKSAAKTLADAIADLYKEKGARAFADEAAQRTLRQKVLDGTITITAAPFRAGWWLTKTTGKAAKSASIGMVKLGSNVARRVPDVAKSGYKSAASGLKKGQKFVVGYVQKHPEEIQDKAVKFVVKNDLKRVIIPYLLDPQLGDTRQSKMTFSQTEGAWVAKGSSAGLLGQELGELETELTRLTYEWGGDRLEIREEQRRVIEKLDTSKTREDQALLESRLIDLRIQELALAKIESRISEIRTFSSLVNLSPQRDLVLSDPRRATYDAPIEVSAENYDVCSATKTYAVPQQNSPYFRMASTQNLKAIAERTKTFSDTLEGTDEGAVWAKAGMVLLDTLMLDVSWAIDEVTKQTDEFADHLRIKVNGHAVWPEGGGSLSGFEGNPLFDSGSIGPGMQRTVGVEYLFRRGDDVRIDLIESDWASDDDSLGSLTIPTTHLYDIEEYDGTYIQETSEGSLYQVHFVIEPLYVPTAKEVERKKLHDVECAPVVKQAKAEQFAHEVETTRVKGRLALLEKFGESGLKTYDNAVNWADYQSCPPYRPGLLLGEWRVGGYNEQGNPDRSVTWTTTFARNGVIVTPSQDGKWREDSLSPGLNVQRFVPYQDYNNPAKWKVDFQEAPYEDRKKAEETCEVYAAMYDEDGVLGGIGTRVLPEGGLEKDTDYREIGREIAFAMRSDPSANGDEAKLYRVAEKSTRAFEAVNFLQDYYRNIPKQEAGVSANLHLTASGPADLWLERIKPVSGGGYDTNESESQSIIGKVRSTITGSWEIGPYKEDTDFPQKTDPEQKRVWVFTEDGAFIEQPENDFWFTPPNSGTWKYIGDQRIEVTTKNPIKMSPGIENVGDASQVGSTFIVKMAQELDEPTEFTGFYVQDSNGRKAIWSKPLHPGKSTYEVPELYSESFFDLLVKLSPGSSANGQSEYFAQREASAKAKETAMAAKLAELKLAMAAGKAACNAPYNEDTLAGSVFLSKRDSVMQGKWRVGEYDSSGRKKHEWSYKKGVAPYPQPAPPLNSAKAVKGGKAIAKFRAGDVSVADDPMWAFLWDYAHLPPGVYQQEWVFPAAEGEKIPVRSRVGNDRGYIARYYKGDVAPPYVDFDDVEYDADKETYVMNKDSGLVQPQERDTFQLSWREHGCNEASVTIPDRFDSYGTGRIPYPVNFIYHENGDKEFYTTKPDGSLYLWGLQEADRTKYTYKFDKKILSPKQAAAECTLELGNSRGYLFDYVDEAMYGEGRVALQNDGLTSFEVIVEKPNEQYLPLQYSLPSGAFKAFDLSPGDKISVFDDKLACVGSHRRADSGEQLTYDHYTLGEGLKPVTKNTDAIVARENCLVGLSDYSFGQGRPAVVEFTNNGSTPLEIYRVFRGEIVSPDGTGRKRAVVVDSSNLKDWSGVYQDLESIMRLEPGSSFTLRAMAGHVFRAITHSTQREEERYNKDKDRNEVVAIGDPEVCYGQIQVTEQSETVAFSDELSEDEFMRLSDERKGKRDEERRIRNNLGQVSDSDPAPNLVSESATPGTPVGITAIAVDGDEQDSVSYQASLSFAIDASTGMVVVERPLDREQDDRITFKVTATSSDGATSETEFTVEVEDADEFDVEPITTYSQTMKKPDENALDSISSSYDTHFASEIDTVGSSVILFASADDKDATDEVQFSLSEDAGGLFVIGPASGEVRTAGVLDYESVKSHTIVVVATSSDGSTSSKQVAIEVRDANEFEVSLVEDVDPASNQVMEEAPGGTPVGIIAQAVDKDGSSTITYKLYRNEYCDYPCNFYEIDPETGVVTTSGEFFRIDLEGGRGLADVAARNLHRDMIALAESVRVIAESSDGSTSLQVFKIEILDENDYPIERTSDTDDAFDQVAENAVIGTNVGITVLALDPDAKANVRYQLKNDAAGRFQIDANRGIVTLARPLDYENAQSHQIQVISTSDDGSTSQGNFEISVQDVSEFSVGMVVDIDAAADTIAENSRDTPVGITVLAKDEDDGSIIRYSLNGKTNDGRFWDSETAPLAIDSETGVVSTRGYGPDFEATPSLTFQVIATSDDGTSSQAQFTLSVTDVDEYDLEDLQDADPAADAVAENSPFGTTVGITAVARDLDGSDKVTYKLQDSSGGLFAIDQDAGIVTVAGELDAEQTDQHYLEVVATSSDGSTTKESYWVSLIDVNEFDVTWEKYPTSTSVRQDAVPGDFVDLASAALDPDVTDTLTFALKNGADVPFIIDRERGSVTVSRSLREVEFASYTLEIVAISTDGSEAHTSIVIPVEGTNDFNVGDISDDDGAFNEVYEDATAGTLVGITVFAKDADGSDAVTYSLANNWGPFAIDPQTGVITVAYADVLDTETKPVETVSVVATSTDGSTNRFDFEVEIKDVNEAGIDVIEDTDSAPNQVEENAPYGYPVGITVFASDFDSTAEVSYRTGEYDSGMFAVDPWSGEVTVVGQIDYETTLNSRVEIEAVSTDGSIQSRSFEIEFLPVNEFDVSPFFDTDPAPNEVSMSAERNADTGITLTASDGDELGYDLGSNSVTFTLSDSDGNQIWGGPFEVDSDGSIYVTNPEQLTGIGPGEHTLFARGQSVDGSVRIEPVYVTIIGLDKWRDNPQGPRIESDYGNVSQEAFDYCIYYDEDPTSAATYNNENAYFDCLDQYRPVEPAPQAKWRDNPQGPRIESDYGNVSQEAFDYCIYYDEDPASAATYNNENAYFDCLDQYLPAPESTDDLTTDTTSQPGYTDANSAMNCARDYGLEAGYSDQTSEVTITNESANYIEVHRVDPSGASERVFYLDPGQSSELTAQRQVVFVGLDAEGACIGARKPMESRTSIGF